MFGGQNMIAENGSMLAESRRFENSIIYSEIDVQRLADERRRMVHVSGSFYLQSLQE